MMHCLINGIFSNSFARLPNVGLIFKSLLEMPKARKACACGIYCVTCYSTITALMENKHQSHIGSSTTRAHKRNTLAFYSLESTIETDGVKVLDVLKSEEAKLLSSIAHLVREQRISSPTDILTRRFRAACTPQQRWLLQRIAFAYEERSQLIELVKSERGLMLLNYFSTLSACCTVAGLFCLT
jgi:hypothetical protein